MRKKLYLITLKDFRPEILIMLSIRVTAKLGGITHQIELKDGFRCKKKTTPKGMI